MIEERLNSRLMDMGYQRMDSNTPGIFLYFMIDQEELSIISVVHVIDGVELTSVQYRQLLEQAKDNFHKSYPHRIKLLSLIYTRYPNRVKHFSATTEQDSHWIIDLSTNRLMIYEMESNSYTGIKNTIEQLLDEEIVIRDPQPSSNIPFTLINTSLVVINIIAFLIANYTGVFGGELNSFINGSLNWYYVLKESQYYRLITAVFMHSGWSHLLNNMFILLFIGSTLERAVGRLRYLCIYFGAGIIAGIASISYNMWKENGIFIFGDSVMGVGASGAIFGLVGALLYIVFINKGQLEEISIRRMIIFIVLSLYSGFMNAQVDQAAHIGGFVGGIILALMIYRRSRNLVNRSN